MAFTSETISEATSTSVSPVRKWRKFKEIGLGYGLLAPAFILLLVFEVYPVIYGFYISMCDWKLTCTKMVFFENYTRAFSDPDMWHSLLITTSYSIISIPLQLGLGLFLAYLLFQKIRGLAIYRMLYFLPYITTTVASAAVWAFLFSPDNGPINKAILGLGGEGLKWLGESKGIFSLIFAPSGIVLPTWAQGPSLALISLIIYTTWVFIGYDIVIFMAGLGNIPGELYDAAKVDGAEGWTLFRHITLPLLSPTTFFLLILSVIGTFKAFNHIYIMTQGGPGDVTTTSSIFIFKQLYQFNRYGYSAALSFIVFLVIMILTIFQNQFAGKRVNYD